MSEEPTRAHPAIDTLWDYGDPAGTEARFRELLAQVGPQSGGEYAIELLTQIARAQGLQQQYEQAQRTLDQADSLLADEMNAGRVRILLERGRVINTSGDPNRSASFFEEAFQLSQRDSLEFLAVDAAHMLGIVRKGEDAIRWNERALELAEAARDPRPRGWLGPLYNNLGWIYHDLKRYEDAYRLFEKDFHHRTKLNRPAEAGIARWSLANTLRHMGRVEEALQIQQELLQQPERQNNDAEGYTREEIAECLLLLDRAGEAAPHFARAWELLKTDPWLSRDEPERLARLRELGRIE